MPVMVVLLVLGGCDKAAPPDASPREASATTGEPEPEPTAPRSRACADDLDCVVNCDSPGDCCGPLCGCDEVVHKAEAEANRKARRLACDGKKLDCPVASCARPDSDVVPRCVESRCVAQTVPHYYADEKYTCESDDDCLVTTTLPNDCCGQKCFPSAVYHEDELAAITAVNEERCTDEDRGRCVEAKCAKPSKTVKAICKDGVCTGKDVPWGQQ